MGNTAANVSFEIDNENVVENTPQNGVSHVLARTTKGKFLDGSTVITTFTQFQKLFGNEIVPDGTISNIRKALELGSKLRIFRVEGTGSALGSASVATVAESAVVYSKGTGTSLILNVSGGSLPAAVNITFGIRTKEKGSPIVDQSQVNKDLSFLIMIDQDGQVVDLNIYGSLSTTLTPSHLIGSFPLYRFLNGSPTQQSFFDVSLLKNFINNNEYLEIFFVSCSDTSITNMQQVYDFLTNNQGNSTTAYSLSDGTLSMSTDQNLYYVCDEGSAGMAPTADQWVSALEAIKDYQDAYQFTCSGINQHLASDTDITKVHKAAALIANTYQESRYFIEVPKYNADKTIKDSTQMLSWVSTMIGSIGYSCWISYFGGGSKYLNDNGDSCECDVIGSILGLADSANSQYGPWYSFAGANRGLIPSSLGPVCPNYGAPSKIDILNQLAAGYVNLLVIKYKKNQGLRTMLWNNYTSQLASDSQRFNSVVGLILYLKKNIRTYIDDRLEDPNTFSTWADIYYDVKDLCDPLVDQNAMTSYSWIGDQDATKYSEMVINNEADVRQGKYKAQLKFKEIVPMVDVTITFTLDKSTGITTTTIDM